MSDDNKTEELRALARVLDMSPAIKDEPTPMLRVGFALLYADKGLAVLPLHWPTDTGCSCKHDDCENQGKHPLTPNGLTDATTDVRAIVKWWTRWPEANVGVRTGPDSDLAVLDVDGPQGEASLRKLPGEIPRTWLSFTGRADGGFHNWFRYPTFTLTNSGGSKGWLGRQYPKLDVRANGGYVVAPPSRHITGGVYRWAGNHPPRAPWPEWLRKPEPKPSQPMLAPSDIKHGDRYALAALEREAQELAAMTPKSGRNEKLNAAVYHLKRKFVTTGMLAPQALVQRMYEAALASGLSSHETERTINSAMKAT